MGNWLPITSKLWPRRSNLMYLAEVAVLTRLVTGVARVLENRPSKQKDPAMTEGQKKQAMVERFFVEILGTVGYMACLHLGQDLVDRINNGLQDNGAMLKAIQDAPMRNKQAVDKLAKELKIEVQELEKKIKQSVQEVYQGNTDNLIYRTLYEHELPLNDKTGKPIIGKTNLAAVKGQLKKQYTDVADNVLDKAFNDIVHEVKPLKKLAQRSNNLAILGIVTGVATSAVMGGTVTQWLNDRVVAPSAKKFFARKKMQKTPADTVSAISQPKPQPAQFGQPLPQKSLSLLSPAPGIPVSSNPATPVYLPNPKTQASNAQFAARIMRPINSPAPLGRPGGLL